MLDCACLAGIVALRHFRKPEVEVEGDEVTVVSIPVVLHVVFGLYSMNTSTHLKREHQHLSLYTILLYV